MQLHVITLAFHFLATALSSQQFPPTKVTVNLSRVTHQLDPMWMGCHSDSGFAHTERGFYSQMIYGESFEFGNQSSWHYIHPLWDAVPTASTSGGLRWNSLVMPSSARGVVGFDKSEAHHGYASLSLSSGSKGAFVGATNRGIGNEGLYLENKSYEGYFFAKAATPVQLMVILRNHKTNTTIARHDVTVRTTEWTRYNFTLNASAATTCHGIVPVSDPTVQCHTMAHGDTNAVAVPPNRHQGHICIQCDGEFAIGLTEPGTAHVDYIFLQPGQWGRHGPGPFLQSGVDALKKMGITSMRLGGSFADPSYYFWKKWTGPPSQRASLGAKWGSELISGFGPFEFLDLCEEARIEPILTTTAQWGDQMAIPLDPRNYTCCSPADMADLIEYTSGDAETPMGR